MDWKRKSGLIAALLACSGWMSASLMATEGQPAGESPAPEKPAIMKAPEVDVVKAGEAETAVPPTNESSVISVTGTEAAAEEQRVLRGVLPQNKSMLYPDPVDEPVEGDEGTRGGPEGGETCATAFVITTLPFSGSGTTTDNVNNYTSPNCNDDVNQARDVVYSYTPAADGVIKISFCDTVQGTGASARDTRVFVFLNNCNAGSEIACNDDAADSCAHIPDRNRQAEIEALPVTAGNTYYIVVDGWNGNNGAYQMEVSVPANGACCDAVGPADSCTPNTPPLNCQCLGERFSEGLACPAPCFSNPTGENCPPNTLFGPGHREDHLADPDTGYFVMSSDSAFGTAQTDGFWDVSGNIQYLSWWGVYALGDHPNDLNGECDKPDLYNITFYQEDCGGPGAIAAGPFQVTALRIAGAGFFFINEAQQQVTSEVTQFLAPLPSPVSLANGWVSIQGVDDPFNPSCRSSTLVYALVNAGPAAGQTGDNSSLNVGGGGIVIGDTLMCLSAANPGACCHSDGSCSDNVEFLNCDQLGDRHFSGQSCASVSPCPGPPLEDDCTGQLFGTGFPEVDPPDLLLGSPALQFIDFAGSQGGINSIVAEGFWGLPDVIGGITWWGSDFQWSDEEQAYIGDCEKASVFAITFYDDDDGRPGLVTSGPHLVSATRAATGWVFTGLGPIQRFSAALPEPVCIKRGWVSIQAQDDVANPNCFAFWLTTDTTTITTGRDDAIHSDNGTIIRGSAMTMCMAPGSSVTGACCNDQTVSCAQTNCAACPDGSRFAPNLACNQMVPLCGQGACCYANGDCLNQTQSACTSGGGTSWTAAFACATDPGSPAGIHCPPVNDNCAAVTPETGGAPYTFTGRTDGATSTDCTAVGPAVWEAFTLDDCSDVVLDFCGTEPAFLGVPQDILMPGCCSLGGAVEASLVSNTARGDNCCINEPPGYQNNYSVEFTGVPGGTWYYPVRSGAGSTGVYTLNVTAAACSPFVDCNGNSTHDIDDIAANASLDCNENSVIDSCDCGDWNADGQTNLVDYNQLQGCFTGPVTAASVACRCVLDADADTNLDLRDYAKFQECRSRCVTCTGTAEGETACFGANDDCAAADPISCGSTICGTLGQEDVDFYTINVPSSSTLTWTVTPEFDATISIVDATVGCQTDMSALGLASAEVSACSTGAVSACVSPGNYLVIVRRQATANVACGSPYRAVATCVAGCTPSGLGACCRFGGCTPNVSRAACDAINGHYKGDGSACSACPAAATAGDECATAIPVTTGNSYTIDRHLFTVNSTDPLGTCEGPTAKDASIWFVWNSPGGLAPTLHLDLCCEDGGSLSDSVITVFRRTSVGGTCPNILTGGQQLPNGCADDSTINTECGSGAADVCLSGSGDGMAASSTYFFMVSLRNASSTAEDRFVVLNVTNICNAFACPTCPAIDQPVCPGTGIRESEPLCGLNYLDVTNNGCSPGTDAPEGSFLPISCGETYCGETGNFDSNGDPERDRDWFNFFLSEETTLSWTVQASGTGTGAPGVDARIFRIQDGCTDNLEVRALASNDDSCSPVSVSATVEAGNYAVTVFGRSVAAATDQPCGTPWIGTLGCTAASDLMDPPNNTCASATPISGPGRYSGYFGSPLVQTPDGRSNCDGVGGGDCSAASLNDVYYRYTAPCTGKVAFEVTRGVQFIILSAHNACPATCDNELPGGPGFSCNDFGGGPSGTLPKIIVDVEAGVDYLIRIAQGAPDEAYEFVVSDCIDCCDPLPSDNCPVCGNGVTEFPEECDDGNANNGDACDNFCRTNP